LFLAGVTHSKPQVLAHVHQFRELRPAAEGIGVILSDPYFYFECFLCGVHCPPGLDYQYASEFMGNFMLYRIETVFSSFNLLRIYLLWRWFADYTLADLPSRYTLAGFSRVKIGTTFILKRTLSSWYGFFYLALGYIVACTIFGYWYRSAELTACQFVPMPVHRGSNITTILHPGCFNGKNIYFMRKRNWGRGLTTFTCRKCKNLDNPRRSIRESQRYLAATQYLVRACFST
jgi:hypothetical protein